MFRCIARHVINTSGPSALFDALAKQANGGSKTASEGWTTLVVACLAFLTGPPAPGEKHPLTYELHGHVISLLITLLSSTAAAGAATAAPSAPGANALLPTAHAEVLRGVLLSAASGPTGGLAELAAAGGSVSEPALRALMLLGAQPFVPPVSPLAATPKAATPVAAAPAVSGGATWAAALVYALLRNVTVDGMRTEDSDTVGPVAGAFFLTNCAVLRAIRLSPPPAPLPAVASQARPWARPRWALRSSASRRSQRTQGATLTSSLARARTLRREQR